MGLQNVEKIVGVDSTVLSWVTEYLEEHPEKNEMLFDVLEIYTVPSGKGYLLKTPSFNCFCWKKDKSINYVLEKLEDAITMSVPLRIVAKTDVTSKVGFRLLLDEDEGPIWGHDGEYLVQMYEGRIFQKDSSDLPTPLPAINTPPSRRRRAK